MWWRRASIFRSQLHLSRSAKRPWLPSLAHFSDAPAKKGKAAPLQERRMRDRVRLWVKGGEGGNGCWSNRRTRTDRHGKPDGGNGGRGGDVILECSAAVWDFSNLQHHLNAKRGGNGESKNKIGSRGSDKVAQVPVGTVIHLVSGEAPSLVVDTSVKSLQPWEIPDADQASQSEDYKPRQNHDNNAGSSRLLNKEHLHVSSSELHQEAYEKPDSTKAEGRSRLRKICSRRITNNKGITAIEYSLDDYETDLEEETEHRDDDDYEDYEKYAEGRGAQYKEEEEEEEEEVQYSVAELTKPGQRLIVARGGEGGLGNVALKHAPKDIKSWKIYKQSRVSADTEHGDTDNEVENENSSLAIGLPGSETILILELKSIADVGLVGMPNAGKSTLLGAISRAKPTVGHYAFTTLRPNIGNLNYDDFFTMTVADIPGLIKGAHENRGLGHAFLRHIERTKVIAYVVDLAAALNGRKGIPPWEQLRDLVAELEHHQKGLSCRPSLIVANKIDEDGADDVYEELKTRVEGVPVYPVCAVLEEGVAELKDGLRRLMDGSESQCLDIDRIMDD